MPNEIWKQVVGWPDYAVSSWGRIFSFKRGTLDRACTHKNAIGDSDLINVRIGPLCGRKADISRDQRNAKRRSRW